MWNHSSLYKGGGGMGSNFTFRPHKVVSETTLGHLKQFLNTVHRSVLQWCMCVTGSDGEGGGGVTFCFPKENLHKVLLRPITDTETYVHHVHWP